MFENLNSYEVPKLKNYWNPLEQIIYVSPITEATLQLLPVNYRDFIRSNKFQSYLNRNAQYFPNIQVLVDHLCEQRQSDEFDCHGIPFFSKCQIKTLERPDDQVDQKFLDLIREVEPSEVSKRRSKNKIEDF
jgi:hypothetical protein